MTDYHVHPLISEIVSFFSFMNRLRRMKGGRGVGGQEHRRLIGGQWIWELVIIIIPVQ